MAKLGVQIVGDPAGLKAALGESLAATQKWATETEGATVKVTEAFKGATTATLQQAAAADKLAIAYGRYGAGTLGAAQATVRYRKELDGLAAAQNAAMRSVGMGLTKFVSLPMAIVGYEAVKMNVAFNAAMLRIQTQAGASAAEVKNLTGQVLELAKTAPQGPEQLAQGLYHAESLGLRGAKAMEVLRESSIAAGMGAADLEEAVSALGGAVVTGIRGTENFSKALGTMTATVGAGNMTKQDLLDALGTGLLPKAKNAGLSLDQVGAALAVLTDRGIGARKAATQLGTTFALMMGPSKAAKKALDDMGIGGDQLAKTLRGPDGLGKALHMLAEGMDRVGKVRGSQDILAAFGRSRQSGAILTLIQSLDSSLSSYDGKLKQIDRTSRAYMTNQKAYLESPSYKLHAALSTLQADLIKLGKALTPGVTKAAEAFAQDIDLLATSFEALPGPMRQAIGIAVAGFAVAGPLMVGIAAVRRSMIALRGAAVLGGVSGIGTAADSAAVEVTSLRTSLLGLGALTLAPIVIPIELNMAHKERDFITKHAGMFGAAGKALLDIATADVAGNPVSDIGGALKGGLSYSNPTIGSSQPTGTPGAPEAAARAAAGRARSAAIAASAATQAAAAVHGGPHATPTTPRYTLSRVAALNLALAKNPNSRTAINAKLAYDREAAAFAEGRIAAGHGSPGLVSSLGAVYSDISSLEGQLGSMDKSAAAARKRAATAKAKAAAKANAFAEPLGLQLAVAKAGTTATATDDVAAAKAIKAYDEKLLSSHKQSLQSQIDIYDDIAKQNSVIGQQVLGKAHVASAAALTAGITNPAQRRLVEQRVAQALAHGGHIPAGIGAGGGGTVYITVHGDANPERTADRVLKKLQQTGRHGTAQRRGPHAGSYMGLH